jgi:hypothetical protein
MPSSVTSATHTQPAAAVQPPPAPSKTTQSKPQPKPAANDTVQLSATAQAQAAALQELRETSNQTVQEAHGGDLQAQRLLAKETAAQAANK